MRRTCLWVTLLAVSRVAPARAGDGYGVAPSAPYSGGASSYLPYGTFGGGFVPYAPGPGGGLGVQSRSPALRAPAFSTATGMGGLGMAGAAFGRPRGMLVPLAPLSVGRAGMSGGLIPRRSSTGAATGIGMGMGTGGARGIRPPVGSYPFRQPPSLVAPGPAIPGMSM